MLTAGAWVQWGWGSSWVKAAAKPFEMKAAVWEKDELLDRKRAKGKDDEAPK